MTLFSQLKNSPKYQGEPILQNELLEAQINNGLELVANGKYEEGLRLLEKLEAKNHFLIAYTIGNGIMWASQNAGDRRAAILQESVAYFDRSIAENPDYGDAWVMRGFAFAYLATTCNPREGEPVPLPNLVRMRSYLRKGKASLAQGLHLNPALEEFASPTRAAMEKRLKAVEKEVASLTDSGKIGEAELKNLQAKNEQMAGSISEGGWQAAKKYFEEEADGAHPLTGYGSALARLHLVDGNTLPDDIQVIINDFEQVMSHLPESAEAIYFTGLAHYRKAEYLFLVEMATQGEQADNPQMLHHYEEAVRLLKEAGEKKVSLQEQAAKLVPFAAERVAVLKSLIADEAEQKMKKDANG